MKNRLYCKFKNIFSSQQKGEKILLSTLSILKKEKFNPQKTLKTAIKNLHTGVKLIAYVKSGKVIYLPAYQFQSSANYYAIKWLYKGAKERSSRSFETQNLFEEIKETLIARSRAFKSRLDLIRGIRKARINLQKRKRFFKFKPFKFKRNRKNKYIPFKKLPLYKKFLIIHKKQIKKDMRFKFTKYKQFAKWRLKYLNNKYDKKIKKLNKLDRLKWGKKSQQIPEKILKKGEKSQQIPEKILKKGEKSQQIIKKVLKKHKKKN